MKPEVDYYVHTQMLIDDVTYPDGSHWENVLGGGTYAVAGMRIWSNYVGFCCAPGPDYTDRYDTWFNTNHVVISGGHRSKNTTHAHCIYFPNGEREEILLPGCATHHESQPLVSEIPENYKECKGMYFFKDCEPEFWNEMIPFLDHSSAVSCWEIYGAAASPDNRDFIGEALHHVDLFSLNRTEGYTLTGKQDPIEIIDELLNLNAKVILFRMSDKGAIVANSKEAYLITAVQTNVVDVTGGGNSSTGGFVTGYCENNGDLVKAGICAAVSASYIIRQRSVPSIIGKEMMQKASRMLQSLLPTAKKLR